MGDVFSSLIDEGFWYDVLWVMKRNAGSPRNQVSMVEVSIGANMKIATAENAVRQIYPNK